MSKQDIVLTDDERQPCEVWTRVMGYCRPVNSFNHGKKAEYEERVCYKEPSSSIAISLKLLKKAS